MKKHEAVIADVDGFATVMTALDGQSKKCAGSSVAKQQKPQSSQQYVMAMYDYKPKSHREVAMKKGEVMVLINAVNKVR